MTPQSALGDEHMSCALMNEVSAYTQKVAYCRDAAIAKSGESCESTRVLIEFTLNIRYGRGACPTR